MLRGKLIVFFVVIVRAVLVSPRHDDAGCPRCCAVIVSRDVSTPLNQFARCRRLAGVAADLGEPLGSVAVDLLNGGLTGLT